MTLKLHKSEECFAKRSLGLSWSDYLETIHIVSEYLKFFHPVLDNMLNLCLSHHQDFL